MSIKISLGSCSWHHLSQLRNLLQEYLNTPFRLDDMGTGRGYMQVSPELNHTYYVRSTTICERDLARWADYTVDIEEMINELQRRLYGSEESTPSNEIFWDDAPTHPVPEVPRPREYTVNNGERAGFSAVPVLSDEVRAERRPAPEPRREDFLWGTPPLRDLQDLARAFSDSGYADTAAWLSSLSDDERET